MAYQEDLHPLLGKAVEHINRVMVGKRDIAILSLAALLAKGHVLLEDVPGVGKNDDGPRAGKVNRRRFQKNPIHSGFAAI